MPRVAGLGYQYYVLVGGTLGVLMKVLTIE